MCPERLIVNKFIEGCHDYELEGSLNPPSNNVLLRFHNIKQPFQFTIDGPFKFEYSDVPESVSRSVIVPNWLIQISLPENINKAGIDFAKKMAQYIADSYQGVVYDLQKDTLVYPLNVKNKFVSANSEERIRLLEIVWFISEQNCSEETPWKFVKLLKQINHKALPMRYGEFEPFENKFTDNTIDNFVDTWNTLLSNAKGETLSWYATKPFWGGSVSFPDKKSYNIPEGAKQRLQISMCFDMRVIHCDKRWIELIVDLFQKIANELKAFYANCYVLRDVIAERNISFDGKSETSPLPKSKWWLGVPITATWLIWFGGKYRNILERKLETYITNKLDNGIIIRFGREPLDNDDLHDIFLPLPTDIVVGYEENEFPLNDLMTKLKVKFLKGNKYIKLPPKPVPALMIPNI